MNRISRWLRRTKLNKEDFLKRLSDKRKQQLNDEYRQYLKRRGSLNMDVITKYLDDNGITYTMLDSEPYEELFDDETNDTTFMCWDPWGCGVEFYTEGVKIWVCNVVYEKKYYSIRTFSFIQIGEYVRCNYWVENDIISLLPHLPAILKEWNEESIIIDREFLKRDKMAKLKSLRDKILQLQSTKTRQVY